MEPKLQFYGRRCGKKIRLRQKDLLGELLPQLAISLPDKNLSPAELFPTPYKEYWLEIGFGGGEHTKAQALIHSDTAIIAGEAFINGVASLLAHISEAELENIRIFPDDIRKLMPFFPEQSISRIYLLFPDPWPKRKHIERRFVKPDNLAELARLLKDGGDFYFASDHKIYVEHALKHLTQAPDFLWQNPSSYSNRPEGWQVTRYEEKALAKGDACQYFHFKRKARGYRHC